jgi:hypothetical protein
MSVRLRLARAHANAVRHSLPIEFHLGVIEQLVFPDQSFDRVLPAEVRAGHVLERIGKVGFILTVAGFLVAAFLIDMERRDLRYLVTAVRDSFVLLFIVLAFIPSVYTIFKRENVQPMKLKHEVLLLLYVCGHLYWKYRGAWAALGGIPCPSINRSCFKLCGVSLFCLIHFFAHSSQKAVGTPVPGTAVYVLPIKPG